MRREFPIDRNTQASRLVFVCKARRLETNTMATRCHSCARRQATSAALSALGILCLTQNFVYAGPPLYRAEVLPPLPGHNSAMPRGMNEAGVIVGYAAADPDDPNSVGVKTAGGALVELSSPNDSWNRPHAVNASEFIVGMSVFTPFKWTGGAGASLPVPVGYFNGAARDVNDSGVACGFLTNDLIGFDLPVYWPNPNAESVMLPGIGGAGEGNTLAINEAGQIAGASAPGGGFFLGARWDDPTKEPVQIGPLPGGHNSELKAINAFGDTAGRSAFPDNTVHAMLHIVDADDLIDLGVLGGFGFSEAFGMNDQLQVVGASSTDFGVGHGFLWHEGAMYDLNDLIATTNENFTYIAKAVEINNAGQIAVEVVFETEAPPEAPAVPADPHRIALLIPCEAGDLDCDGAVNAADLAVLLGAWGKCFPEGPALCPADLNGDGLVNAADLAMLLGNWS